MAKFPDKKASALIATMDGAHTRAVRAHTDAVWNGVDSARGKARMKVFESQEARFAKARDKLLELVATARGD